MFETPPMNYYYCEFRFIYQGDNVLICVKNF